MNQQNKHIQLSDVCEVTCVDKEKVKRALIDEQKAKNVATLFKALSDPKRIKIAYALLQEEELCVCDIASVIDSSVATASHHLRTLKKQGLAKYRKVGKLVYYSLDDEHVKQVVALSFAHEQEVNHNE
ncbi:ArsR/SmtB family transcription factor [Texcoconibacillus texcoconensis]|uniref:DNA-binding transcriptional ArsR family regulator n=1 Tax=Texcoconibacillus texcoconensis TaxID=1095777 RepID=A0A840QS23_9BACI|nr:metalloregulator ArsR/SmtB family transcription factor [Texcoconibacillus texcoconensis]MBB5174164.1 DNA-binding transcriptional ArsR family regulator [Texcoconibacillus texcoconensis]